MPNDNEVTDASDWLGTPLASVERLDHALRCQVCKEFLQSPMITTCAHTFCSLCIRRCLSADGKCPFCRASDQPNQLRKNTAMEEVVKVFLAQRPDLLKLGRDMTEPHDKSAEDDRNRTAKKRDVSEAEMDTNPSHTPRKTRARARREPAGKRHSPVVVDDSEEEAQSTESENDDWTPNDGLVACPICQRRMPEERVFNHLETHDDAKKTPPTERKISEAKGSSLPMRKNEFKPLPGLNYSMLNETTLRKRLQSLGIPTSGSKAILQRRHAEWLNIWNANCDSTNPRSQRELLRDLDNWEKTQNRPQQVSSAGTVMDKEFDGRTWASSHGNDFKDLIAKARGSRKTAPNENGDETEHHERDPQSKGSRENLIPADNQILDSIRMDHQAGTLQAITNVGHEANTGPVANGSANQHITTDNYHED